tara:strand:+ start:22130 stop:22285 length:156 start_codon:yes stop_codon:yes gene_type:complete
MGKNNQNNASRYSNVCKRTIGVDFGTLKFSEWVIDYIDSRPINQTMNPRDK